MASRGLPELNGARYPVHMADGRGGSAQTLRDYWEGHGHSGPSHGAERDAIGWGTPGDFDRCVAQVTEHGHMTPEQAKGYCNLRHHGALGYWPAQHARMEKGVDLLTKAADGSGEARVPPGKVTGGQFTVGGDGPSTAPKKPNPYGKKGGKGKQGKTGPKGSGPGGKQGRAARRAALKKKIAGLEGRLNALLKEERELTKGPVGGAASTKTGTQGSSVSSNAQASTSQSSSSSSQHSSTAAGTSKLGQVQQQIKQLRAQIKAARSQLASTKAWEGPVTKASRNQRDRPTGRFRTFEGERDEAVRAFQEGRVGDAVDFLGSARALASDPGHRTVLSQMQHSLSRTQHVVPDVTKAGPHGYEHGWKKVAPDAARPIKGDTVFAEHEDGTQITGIHDGTSSGRISISTARQGRVSVPREAVRHATPGENEAHMAEYGPSAAPPAPAGEAAKG